MPLPAQVPTLTNRYIPTLHPAIAKTANAITMKAQREYLKQNSRLAVELHRIHVTAFGSGSLTTGQLANMVRYAQRYTAQKSQPTPLAAFMKDAYQL